MSLAQSRRVVEHDSENLPEFPELAHLFARPVDTLHTMAQPLDLTPGQVHVRRVETGHYRVNIAVNTSTPGRRLIVMLHGARADAAEHAALFRRISWSNLLGCTILSISDPVSEPLWPTPMPRSSAYIGSIAHDLVPEINALVDKVAAELGVAAEDIVFDGMSAGAAAVMLVASRRPCARIVASNPVTTFSQFPRWVVDAWLACTGHSRADLAAAIAESPWRFDAPQAVLRGLAQGHDLRLFIAHNLADRGTTVRHYPALREALGVTEMDGGLGADGRALVTVYRHHSHMVEPFGSLMQAALAWFELPAGSRPGPGFPGLKPGRLELADEPDDGVEAASGDGAADTPTAAPSPLSARPGLPALAPPSSGGHLFLCGSPGSEVHRLAHVLCGARPICLGNERYGRRLRELSHLTPALYDDEQALMNPKDGEMEFGRDAPQRLKPVDAAHDHAWSAVRWRGDKLHALWRHYEHVLRGFPLARIVFVTRNPVDAIAAGALRLSGASPDEAAMHALIEEWNQIHRATAEALRTLGERIMVIDAETLWRSPAGLAPVLDWLSVQSRPAVERRYEKSEAAVREADAAAALLLSPGQRRQILLQADLAAWQLLSSR